MHAAAMIETEHLSCNCRGQESCCNPHIALGVTQTAEKCAVVAAEREDDNADNNNLADVWDYINDNATEVRVK